MADISITGRVIAVVGATGTGKSDLALELALRHNGEVVNADSMQVYRGMDIGTAKLPIEQRRGVVHHLLDIWPVTQAANVAEYQRLARQQIDAIHARGRLPILVGGSGLYVRAVLEEFDFPGHDPRVRTRLEAQLGDLGSNRMHDLLAAVDPAAAQRILPTNGRRIVRALEVIEITGGPFAAALPLPRPHYLACTVGLRRDRESLDAALSERVDRMWTAGLVDEVAGLTGLRGSPTASRALGYRQVLDLLGGLCDEESAKEATVRATRKFARRQEAWFRRDDSIRWLEAQSPTLGIRAQAAVEEFLASGERD